MRRTVGPTIQVIGREPGGADPNARSVPWRRCAPRRRVTGQRLGDLPRRRCASSCTNRRRCRARRSSIVPARRDATVDEDDLAAALLLAGRAGTGAGSASITHTSTCRGRWSPGSVRPSTGCAARNLPAAMRCSPGGPLEPLLELDHRWLAGLRALPRCAPATHSWAAVSNRGRLCSAAQRGSPRPDWATQGARGRCCSPHRSPGRHL